LVVQYIGQGSIFWINTRERYFDPGFVVHERIGQKLKVNRRKKNARVEIGLLEQRLGNVGIQLLEKAWHMGFDLSPAFAFGKIGKWAQTRL
jgi:hypothetical protein